MESGIGPPIPGESLLRAALAGDLLLQQDEQCSLCYSWRAPWGHREPLWGHRDPNRILCPCWSLFPLGSMGFPLALGHSGSGGGYTDRAPASSWAGWIQCCCSASPWAFCHGKALQPGTVGAGEAEMLLELHCCCPRASSGCFVTGFGGAGGKSVDLPFPRQAQGTPHPLVLIPPSLGGTQG